MPMALKDTLTDDQFYAVYNGPLAAALYVATVEGGLYSVSREVQDAARLMDEAARGEAGRRYGELVDALFIDIRSMSAEERQDYAVEFLQTEDMGAMHLAARDLVTDAWDAVAGLPGAEGFRQLLLDAGEAAAAAGGRGGFLGRGDKDPVSPAEREALAELAGLMTPEA